MLNWRNYLDIFFIIAIVVIVISIVISRIIASRQEAAVNYARQQYYRYRRSYDYRPIMPDVARQIYKKLFTIPEHYWADTFSPDRFWHDGYAELLEVVLALNTEAFDNARLVYGSFEETRRKHKNKNPFQQLFWIEFIHCDRKWVFWLDMPGTTNAIGETQFHCCEHTMFHDSGTVSVHDSQSANHVLVAYRKVKRERGDRD